tara:strand:- start:617 stop:922 length:306 start_codon:yes stop_codon:yes gene_type:complete
MSERTGKRRMIWLIGCNSFLLGGQWFLILTEVKDFQDVATDRSLQLEEARPADNGGGLMLLPDFLLLFRQQHCVLASIALEGCGVTTRVRESDRLDAEYWS